MKLFKSNKPVVMWLTSFILLLCLVVTSTVAWFSMNSVVQITSPSDANLAVQVNSGDLEVAVAYQQTSSAVYGRMSDYSAYGQKIDLQVDTPQFIDVSGNGEHLYFPRALNDKDQPIDALTNWDEVTDAMGYCLTLKTKFRTSQKMTVFLDKDSFVSGIENITGGSYTRSSALGNFSCDGICAAVRVAFLEVIPSSAQNPKEQLILKTVWVPNDTYRLSYSADGLSATYTTTGAREESYQYWYSDEGIIKKESFDFLDIKDGLLTVGDYGLAENQFSLGNTATPLLEFEANGEMQEKEMIIRIWFEGTDNEADKALDGGAIKYNFCFTGLMKSAESTESTNAIDGIKYYGSNLVWADNSAIESNKILYSFDCITWNPYSTGANLSGYSVVYVRAIETANTFAGHIYAIDK